MLHGVVTRPIVYGVTYVTCVSTCAVNVVGDDEVC